MHRPLNRLLLLLALPLVAADIAWIALGHFAIDARNYVLVSLMVLPLAVAAVFYDKKRDEPALSATLAVAAFLIVFPAAASLTSYLLLTIAGPRIDGLLANADLALGFHWIKIMALAAAHPHVTAVLSIAYMSVLPQTVVLIFVLGLRGKLDALYGLTLTLAFGAVITLAFWTCFPSFGAFSVFPLSDAVAGRLGLALGADYSRVLTTMLRDGPGFITPTEIRGLVGFPSYHTLQALTLFWYARKERWLFWPSLALNILVLFAVPIHGGHHLMDMLGGLGVTGASIWLSRRAIAWAKSQGTRQTTPLQPALAVR